LFPQSAGCDSLDSDGDRKKDNCEDQYPPELIVRNAEMFQCENSTDNPSRFCYTGAVFNDDTVVMKFLKYQFAVIDDCQSVSKLDVNITQVAGTSCNATRYQITPIQNTGTNCTASGPNPSKHNITHVNPLNGASKEVEVQLDMLPTIIKCGFNSTLHLKRNNSVSSDGKTLYHRAVNNSSNSGLHLMMKKAEFFYDITVSLCVLFLPNLHPYIVLTRLCLLSYPNIG
jgi:hypothetical protein